MINHREILRLESLGLDNTQIEASCECARSTVIEVLQRPGLCTGPRSLSHSLPGALLAAREKSDTVGIAPANPRKPLRSLLSAAFCVRVKAELFSNLQSRMSSTQ